MSSTVSQNKITHFNLYSSSLVQEISEQVITMFTTVSEHAERSFNRDLVDGGLNTACVETEDQFCIAMIYIADCFTFGRNIDLETFNLERERNRIVDVLLMVLDFE